MIPMSSGETKDDYYQPLEKAETVRSGSDVTIMCYSRMRYVVMQAVQQLESQGYDPEVFPPSSSQHSNHLWNLCQDCHLQILMINDGRISLNRSALSRMVFLARHECEMRYRGYR